jgi:hypothetical protein
MHIVLLTIVRPLVLLALLLIAYGLSRAIYRLIPTGPLKDFLYRRRRLY